ncbi:hypothetical protein [Neobacillus sp. SuZ13]|uniref:hypothetical protein n=1 Tax=Neobacillus sp. SuZ13 TaxID=3047875 RepID=UPI0024BFE227|nr:hypothetical protein [Neobacillus sp. SuZ13]WHY65967.1 hypothetical protein QNH17_23210 [Neobacillus sp. SuZ13]
MMGKNEQNKKFVFEFNEHGANEVSQQILDSYNSGFIGEGTAIADNADFAGSES